MGEKHGQGDLRTSLPDRQDMKLLTSEGVW